MSALLDGRLDRVAVLDRPGSGVDLEAAECVTYSLEQTFRYDYPDPVHQLRHRLVVLPPLRHGSQHLRSHQLDIDGSPARRTVRRDSRGNTVVRVSAPRVDRTVAFGVTATLERVRRDGPVRIRPDALHDPRFRRATRLTAPDEHLAELAHDLRRYDDTPRERAHRVCELVHSTMTYTPGATTVRTTAAEALAGGHGVCQDAAHIMLALCHLLAIPARYVSGHLLGQGGTHAWVETLLPAADHAVAVALDPCHGVETGARYLTVATGRDYADVPPTSGVYIGSAVGALTSTRRLTVVAAA